MREGAFRHTVLAAQIGAFRTGLMLGHDADDLLVRKSVRSTRSLNALRTVASHRISITRNCPPACRGTGIRFIFACIDFLIDATNLVTRNQIYHH